ncbi:hypothetical protein PAJ34TS1_00680 [Paenibacillus azoreducens]
MFLHVVYRLPKQLKRLHLLSSPSSLSVDKALSIFLFGSALICLSFAVTYDTAHYIGSMGEKSAAVKLTNRNSPNEYGTAFRTIRSRQIATVQDENLPGYR